VDGEPALLVKVFNLPGLAARASYLLRPSKARLEGEVARRIRARGFDAVVPLAVGEERRAGLLLRSLVAVAERPAIDLTRRLRDPQLLAKARRELLTSFARFNRELHEAGVDQDDTAPNNFLVYPDGRFALVDFERCQLRSAPLPQARRWTLLAKLHRHPVGVPAADKLRFLRAYLGSSDSRAARRAAWGEIRDAFLRLRRRDARRAGRAAFKLGRHVRRSGETWELVWRSEAPTLRRDLDPARARLAWIRAHQLERLNLPAVRPVRLARAAVELERPPGASDAPPSACEVARALRKFSAFGRFRDAPQWCATPAGAVLTNPESFSLFRK
jgi:hypothetical protein